VSVDATLAVTGLLFLAGAGLVHRFGTARRQGAAAEPA
jgi:hypothetical protein